MGLNLSRIDSVLNAPKRQGLTSQRAPEPSDPQLQTVAQRIKSLDSSVINLQSLVNEAKSLLNFDSQISNKSATENISIYQGAISKYTITLESLKKEHLSINKDLTTYIRTDRTPNLMQQATTLLKQNADIKTQLDLTIYY